MTTPQITARLGDRPAEQRAQHAGMSCGSHFAAIRSRIHRVIRRLAWGLGLAAALGRLQSGARSGATVLYASGADLPSINPLLTSHPLARQVQRYVLLTTSCATTCAEPQPYLARRWTWSADRRQLTFT